MVPVIVIQIMTVSKIVLAFGVVMPLWMIAEYVMVIMQTWMIVVSALGIMQI